MANLTRSEISLLEKLYNLRGEDSTILKSIEQEAESVETLKSRKEDESRDVKEIIEKLTTTIQDLKDTSDSFIARFSDCKRSDYETLLTEIDLPFDPEAAVLYVQEKTPPKLEELQKNKETKEKESSELLDEIEEAKLKLAELDRDKENAGKNKDNLNKLLSEILEGNLNITVQELTDLLKELRFNETECNEAGKLLFFSDALVRYDEMLKTKDNQKEQQITDVEEKEQTTVEETIEHNEPTKEEKLENSGAGLDELNKLLESAKEENASVETEYYNIDELEANETKVPTSESMDAKTILEKLKVSVEENADLIADPDFGKKYELLKAYAEDEDIALHLQVIRGNSYQDLVQKETKLNEAGISPAILPLSVFEENNVENYITNVKYLNAKGYALDENELAKQAAVLYTDSTIFAKNLDATISYKLNFKKSNGKLPIDILAQNTEELVGAMDKVIESSLEAILSYSPEFIGKDINEILQNISTLKENSITYRSPDGKFKGLLGNPFAFRAAVGGSISGSASLVSQDENNATLASRINTKEIIDVLNAGTMQYVDTNAEEKDQAILGKVSSLSDISDYSFKIAGVPFSKKKFLRNLIAIRQGLAKQGITASEEDITLSALLHNSNKKEEEMKLVAETLGFNVAMGGIRL